MDTIGREPPLPGYPTTLLSLGRLNLPAADARFTPGQMPPVIYAEIKAVRGALRSNALYQQAAAMPGRFAALRNNRLHADPWLGSQSSAFKADQVGRSGDASMVVYHGFYPADDEARRHRRPGATNREFHHLAVGLLFPSYVARSHQNQGHENVTVFVCRGPDMVRMMPLSHPFVQKVNSAGHNSPNGRHVVVFSILQSPNGYNYANEPSDANKDIIVDSVGKSAPWKGRILGGLTFIAIGAAAGAPFGPVGALIGAAIALVVYILISLICYLFGCGEHDDEQWQQKIPPQPGSGGTFGQALSNDIAPPGVATTSGGAKPARTFELKMIPHFPDLNLYGLNADGAGTLRIVEDPAQKEMLAWHAFPAGIGYQFDRAVPGNEDVSGSSLRNYFDLFVKKALEVNAAQQDVVYFGEA
jgi:hypothetical protein